MIFYVIYVADVEVGPALDLIKIICNPFVKTHAHVTLRGPYTRKADDARAWNKKWVEEKNQISAITFKGLLSFFRPGQNAVSLGCEFPEVQELWYKPDYPHGVPHLTLYDGESREFADDVLKVLGRFDWNFEVSATPLKPLRAGERGQWSMVHLTPNNEIDRVFERLTGHRVSSESIRDMKPDLRLEVVDQVCQYISRVVAERSKAHAADSRTGLRTAVKKSPT